MTLSILCITKDEPHYAPFREHQLELASDLQLQLVICYDKRDEGGGLDIVRGWPGQRSLGGMIYPWRAGQGFVEEIHDHCVSCCTGDYILRLDDDERCSPAMVAWLADHKYESHDHWKFPRAHLWGDDQTVLVTPQLWPDHQTRLSIRAKAGGRNHIHAGSPFGGGELAPCVIEHHKFLVKPYAERQSIADRYDAIQHGAGRVGGMAAFQCPEEAYRGTTQNVVPLGDGSAQSIDRPEKAASIAFPHDPALCRPKGVFA